MLLIVSCGMRCHFSSQLFVHSLGANLGLQVSELSGLLALGKGDINISRKNLKKITNWVPIFLWSLLS